MTFSEKFIDFLKSNGCKYSIQKEIEEYYEIIDQNIIINLFNINFGYGCHIRMYIDYSELGGEDSPIFFYGENFKTLKDAEKHIITNWKKIQEINNGCLNVFNIYHNGFKDE